MQKKIGCTIEECTETVGEVKLAEITIAENKNSRKCSSCTVHIVLFSRFFAINVGIYLLEVTYFVYSHWCLNKDVLHTDVSIQTTIY